MYLRFKVILEYILYLHNTLLRPLIKFESTLDGFRGNMSTRYANNQFCTHFSSKFRVIRLWIRKTHIKWGNQTQTIYQENYGI